jgi:UDP-glucose 4-epimerase
MVAAWISWIPGKLDRDLPRAVAAAISEGADPAVWHLMKGQNPMAEKQVILVSGAAGYWGFRVATRLMTEPGYQLIGLDAEHPSIEIKGLDFVRADIRNALLVELLRAERVDTVCHLAFVHSYQRSEADFENNVMGTAKLLAACAEAGVRRVVLRSSMTVYGARPTNPAFLTEESPLRGSKRYGYVRDLVEIETFCNVFRRRVPQMNLTVLRFASIVGPSADTPMVRFLKQPWAPSLMGFDPMMQVIHEDDVVEALAYAALNDVPGAFNVAAEGVLPLSKIRGLAGKLPVAVLHPFAYWGVGLMGGIGLPVSRYMPIEPNYLRYPWVGDLTRMHRDLGFEPLHTAEDTLCEFTRRARSAPYRSGSINETRAEEWLRDIIEQRRSARGGPGLTHSEVEGGDKDGD